MVAAIAIGIGLAAAFGGETPPPPPDEDAYVDEGLGTPDTKRLQVVVSVYVTYQLSVGR